MKLFFTIAVLAAASWTDAKTKESASGRGPLGPSRIPGPSFPGGGLPTGGYFDGSFSAGPVGGGPVAAEFVRRPFGGESGGAPGSSIATGPGAFNGDFPHREAGYTVGGAEGNFVRAPSSSGPYSGAETFGPASVSGHESFSFGMGNQGGFPGFVEGQGASSRVPGPNAGFERPNRGWGSESGHSHSRPEATAGNYGPASEGPPGFPGSFSNGPIFYPSAPRVGYYPVLLFGYGGPHYYGQRYDAYGSGGLRGLSEHESYGPRHVYGLYQRY